jgi:hypothetical protein
MAYIQWVLRQPHHNCVAHIPVPVPKQTGTFEDPLGMPKDATTAAFLCPECGFVTLYSQLHLDREIVGTPDLYSENRLHLVYLLVGCVDSNCESQTKIRVVCDKKTGLPATKIPMQKWVFDSTVVCAKTGNPLLFFPAEFQQFYLADMPF